MNYSTFHAELDQHGQSSGKNGSKYQRRILSTLFFTSLILGLIATIAIFNSSSTSLLSYSFPFLKISKSTVEVQAELSISSPGYGKLANMTNYLPWKLIAEPARTQTLLIDSLSYKDGNTVIDLQTISSFTLTINDQEYSSSTSSSSSSSSSSNLKSVDFQVSASLAGSFVSFTLTIQMADGTILTVNDRLIVKYVRREYRTLTSEDHQRLMAALYVIYSTAEDSLGQATYGSTKFHSAKYFLMKHLIGGGSTDCDHWHDGAGIVTHHSAVTLEFEQSLQAIDASLTMPYWEYPMDYHLIVDKDKGSSAFRDPVKNPLFSTSWLGSIQTLAPNTYQITDTTSESSQTSSTDSFWSTLTMPDGTGLEASDAAWSIASSGSLNPFHNAYGLLRTPWNNNPNPYLGRYNLTYDYNFVNSDDYPSCSDLKNAYSTVHLSVVNSLLNGVTHGPVHMVIGGAWRDESRYTVANDFLSNYNALMYFKILWRKGLTRCPKSCNNFSYLGVSIQEALTSCRCSVPEEYIKRYGVRHILDESYVGYAYNSTIIDYSEAELLEVLRLIEDPGMAGEMFTSGATYDPSFWPIHGALERLVSLKRIKKAQGVFDEHTFNETWGYAAYEKKDTGGPHLIGRCDWSAVKGGVEDLTLPVCDETAACPGQGAEDILEFSNFVNKQENYTNQEMYDFIHPWNEELPYIFDHYDYDYCETMYGIEFLPS